MTKKIVPLDVNKHSKLRINVDPNYGHVANQNMVPLVAFEFLKAGADYPIVFVKQQETGRFKSVALMGIEEGENLYFQQGKIHADYVPVNIRRYPFSAGGTDVNNSNMVLCIDENSSLFNETDGVKIFDDNGELSQATVEVADLISDLIARDQATDAFIDFLTEHELLQSAELTLKLGADGERKINGIYKVDEEQLNLLSDEVALALYKRKYFAAIYAHLGSLSRFNRLLQLRAKYSVN